MAKNILDEAIKSDNSPIHYIRKVKTMSEIKELIAKTKSELSGKYRIKSVAIFGSYARNEQTPESDLDLLVEFSENIGIKFIDLADEIESQLGMKIDLVSRKGLKDHYFRSIKSDLIYV